MTISDCRSGSRTSFKEESMATTNTILKPVSGTVESTDGTTIAFDRYGDGPALILVGGALQYRSYDQPTAELARLLAEHFTVYHYDRRGRGDSGDRQPYAVEREIEDLASLIAEAGETPFLFGNSSGAHLCLDGILAGLPAAKLATYEAPLIVDDSRSAVPDDYRAELRTLLAEDRRGDAVELFMIDVVGIPGEFVSQMRQGPFWSGFEAAAPSLANDGELVGDTMSGHREPLARWRSIAVPTLVISGGNSDPWVTNGADALAETLGQAHHLTLPGQTHAVAPDALAPALVEFFRA
jgi:pimeloyl-ACP methyl ester carboxylesterase